MDIQLLYQKILLIRNLTKKNLEVVGEYPTNGHLSVISARNSKTLDRQKLWVESGWRGSVDQDSQNGTFFFQNFRLEKLRQSKTIGGFWMAMKCSPGIPKWNFFFQKFSDSKNFFFNNFYLLKIVPTFNYRLFRLEVWKKSRQTETMGGFWMNRKCSAGIPKWNFFFRNFQTQKVEID